MNWCDVVKYALFLVGALLASIGVYFLRRIDLVSLVGNFTWQGLLGVVLDIDLWIGVFFYGLAFVVFLFIINRYEVSSAMPALMGVYIITLSVFSYFVFGDAMSLQKLAAYGLIIAGIALLS
ncbi:MAG: hypothetical protein ACK4GK_06220 [Ferrovibrio sp.]